MASALTNVGLVLERRSRHLAYQEAARDVQRLQRLQTDPALQDQKTMDDEYAELGLSEQYRGVIPTDEEADALGRVLLELLRRGPPILLGASGALGHSRCVFAIPHLADAVRRYAAVDGFVTRVVIYALSNLLASVGVERTQTDAQQAMVREGFAALRLAAAEAVQDPEGVEGARAAAEQELSELVLRFGQVP